MGGTDDKILVRTILRDDVAALLSGLDFWSEDDSMATIQLLSSFDA
jgi:hypothetical protein